MHEFLIGIDPGQTGAIVVLSANDFAHVESHMMPTMNVGNKVRVNASELAAILRPYVGRAQVVLELVGVMPKQGGVSAFSFGYSAGAADGVVAAIGLPVTLVTPAVWKRRAGVDVKAAPSKGKKRGKADALPEGMTAEQVAEVEAARKAAKSASEKAKRDNKEIARGRAIQLWPAWRELAKTKAAGQALADAALMARFGLEVIHA